MTKPSMPSFAHAKRLVYLTHRWTGVGFCVLMLIWLVSGVVMLFVGFPKLLPAEHLRALPALPATDCCVPVQAALAHSESPTTVRQILLTSIGDEPRYRLKEASGRFIVVDARTGQRMHDPDRGELEASARAFIGASATGASKPIDIETVREDRWTHPASFDAHRPLHKARMDDPEATTLYLSSSTGEVVLDLPRAQQAWNYVGAWLHWLYMFRDQARDPVWHWLVVVLSAAGTLSVMCGALAGIWRWRFRGRYRSGARTPYREFHARWHHVTGLLFGTVLVTWIFSGLMSMNPLGVFDPVGRRPDAGAMQGGAPGRIHLDIATNDALQLLHDSRFDAVEIEWRVLDGAPYLLATSASGSTRLLTASQTASFRVQQRWSDDELQRAGTRLLPARLLDAQPLQDYDRFFYRRGEASMYAGDARRLPTLRLRFDDPGQTWVYLDPFTGEIALSVDRAQRSGRWLFNLLHSWDLPGWLRHASLRDSLLSLLSAGALLIALTGTVIGIRRLRTSVSKASVPRST